MLRDKLFVFRKNVGKENIIGILFSFVLVLLFGFNSPLHPWIGREAATDSSVFKTVALMMEHGYMPYKDSFDHKGPLLYIINFLGDMISQYRGVWAIEMISLAVTIFMMYKISRMSSSIISSFFSVVVSFSLLFKFFKGGNLVEEYAMPLIAISTYIFIDYLKNNIISLARIIIAGACFGMTLMLRPNMIAIWIVYCISILIFLLIQKEYKILWRYLLLFLLGIIIVIMPILLWLVLNQDLSFFLQDYIIFNFKYSSATLNNKWECAIVFFENLVYVIAMVSMAYHTIKNANLLNVSYMCYLLLTVFMIAMGGAPYEHYGMVMVPAVAYPLSLLFEEIENIEDKQTEKVVYFLTTMFLICEIIANDWMELIKWIPADYVNRNENNRTEAVEHAVELIDVLTDEDDLITVYGNFDIIYVLSNRKHATRYSYQYPIRWVRNEIIEEYFNELQEEMPKIVVVEKNRYDEEIDEFINNNKYSIVYAENNEEKESGLQVFSRIQEE
ncbi:hypothetical protein [Butyrivibrio sp. YAB3001]|uniref:hypothetical protein n=1 Tax=Butyrivibrio sp. YAB3001 TaxID=1520812 RepID=UPI0008F67603|nr:hypothetical protein [Butyrivibrio sp. YAB3001]SFC74919.1 hypothetical protein SAMN02910398_03062 [Butyrivibrio sp. YAB3001]